ncbi:DUF4435 domain-containing protein [Acinetobacter baumannii]
MANLEYSSEAKNVLNRFHRVDKIVYVEGQDDVPFWDFLFRKFSKLDIYIEEVGGKENLKSYIDEIMTGDANFLVAKDMDFDFFKSSIQNHRNIITTAGYSIENSLVQVDILSNIIKNLSLTAESKINVNEIKDWVENLEKCLKDLIILGIYNDINSCGISVIPNNADRFVKSKRSYSLCDGKIKSYIGSLNLNCDESVIVDLTNKLKSFSHLDFINGHFLISAAHRFVTIKSAQLKKATSREKIQCSNENFLALLIGAFELRFNANHPHYSYYSEKMALVA